MGLSIDLSTLPLEPLSGSTRRCRRRHVIDGEVVSSKTGETMAIVNPPPGRRSDRLRAVARQTRSGSPIRPASVR